MAGYELDFNVRATPEWLEAQQRYQQLHTWSVFSVFGVSPMMGPTLEEMDQGLAEILEGCPEYFPAWFHRGEFMLRIGETAKGEGFIDKAFDYTVNIITEEEEFRRLFSPRIENLEKLLRYDLAVKYLEKALRLFPDTATYYDELAFYITQLPGRDNNEAIRREHEALEIEPDNDYFINNLGWVYLMMGNCQQAVENFQKALEFNTDNTTAWENLETAEYMQQHGLTYFEYLLRPADMNTLNEFLQAADFEGVKDLCKVYNTDRREAFKIYHLQKKSLAPHEILNILQPLRFFMNTLESIIGDEIFLYESMNVIHDQFKYLLYRFILGSEHVDPQLLEDIGGSLTVFYDFLRETRLVSNDQYKRFIDLSKSLIKEFSTKIDRYDMVRHDVTLSEEEREEKIKLLFGVVLGE